MVEIFLSYCWSDDQVASDIFDKLSMNKEIVLHRDKIDIGPWKSIKEYMQSINQMDYVILLISDAYLRSPNCMYEVLEVMRDRKYKERIFPVIIYPGIYKPQVKAQYVLHWQKQFRELDDTLSNVNRTNLGRLGDNLRQYQEIASHVADFLDYVSDLNNPHIKDVPVIIEQKLQEKGFITEKDEVKEPIDYNNIDLFDKFNIENTFSKEITDLDVHRYMLECFQIVNSLFEKLCKQFEIKDKNCNIIIEKIDSRTFTYAFYKNGQHKRSLKIFLDDLYGRKSIGVSDDVYSFSSGKSWNEMYTPNCDDGEIKIFKMLNANNRKSLSDEEIVKDIWERFVTPYI